MQNSRSPEVLSSTNISRSSGKKRVLIMKKASPTMLAQDSYHLSGMKTRRLRIDRRVQYQRDRN